MAFLIPVRLSAPRQPNGERPTQNSPAPNVQANLDAAVHGHTGMKTFLPPSPFGIEILPKHGTSSPGQERDTIVLLGLFAVDKFTPPRILGPGQQREIRAAAGAVCLQVDHESAGAAGCVGGKCPVVVVRVVARDGVALGPEALDEGVCGPALEVQSPLLDALDRVVAVDHCLVALADAGVCRLDVAVVDCRGLPLVLTFLEV